MPGVALAIGADGDGDAAPHRAGTTGSGASASVSRAARAAPQAPLPSGYLVYALPARMFVTACKARRSVSSSYAENWVTR